MTDNAQTIEVNGITVSYEIAGAGGAAVPWVIFSHSLGCSKSMWQPQFEALSKSYRVLRYDTRGHGASSAPAGPYTLDLLAQDVQALCAALGIEKCHFVGLSMGGMIGQTVALNYPQLLASLTLADTSSSYGATALAFWEGRSQTVLAQGMQAMVTPSLERWFTAPFRAAQPALMQQAGQWILDTPVVGYAACCLAIAGLDTTARLPEIKIPALVIVGADDLATAPAVAELIHAQITGSQLVVLPSAAHISNVEQPERFTAVVQDFLRESTV